MFSVREELFDYAANGNISFDHPAYTSLRSMLNGYLRFGHKISLVHFLGILLMTLTSNKEYMPQLFTDRWKDATEGLDPKTVEDLEAIRLKAGSQLAHFVFFSSFTKKAALALTLVVPVFFIAAWTKLRDRDDGLEVAAFRYTVDKSETFRSSMDQIESEAYTHGKYDSKKTEYAFA